MIIHLGKTCRPQPCGEGQGVFNAASCDPTSFASLISMHLGIPVSADENVVEMNAVLAKHARADDFFYQSYSVDPIGVSNRILALTDEISIGGKIDFEWSKLSGSTRISQLARIAAEFESRQIVSTVPTTLRTIIRALKDSSVPIPISCVILSEPSNSWAHLWQTLFETLSARGCQIDNRKTEILSTSATDLSRVAQSLLVKPAEEQMEFADDDSILRINGASVLEAADAVAYLIHSELEKKHTVTIVSGGEPDALDAGLARQNLPILGVTRTDRGSGPVEILPLMIDLISGPPDPTTFLEFLNIEPHPLPTSLRSWLIRELNNNCAVDSDNACAIVDQYSSKIEDEKISQRTEAWKRWLRFEHEGELITAESLQPTLDQIESWASASLALPKTDDNLRHGFGTLLGNVKSLRDAIASTAGAGLSRIQLQSLIAQVLSPARITTQREQSCMLAVNDPAAVPSPTDIVIWWMAHDTLLPRTKRSIWTDAERSMLANAGVEFQNPEISSNEAYAAAMRLLAMAKKRLVIVTVDRIGDDPVAVHPLWYEIEESFTDTKRPTSFSVQRIWAQIGTEGQKNLDAIDPALQTPFHSAWEIPQAPYAARERESPSSLEKMLGCPLAWTLQYRAGLYDGSSHSLADGFLLLGTLAHACFEEFFKKGASILTQNEAETAAKKIFEHCLKSRAGILLTPGRDKDRLDAEAKTVTGMLDLASIMTAGGWEFVAAEESVEATDLAQPIRGRFDLLFRRTKNPSEKLVIDVKYVGKRRRQQEIVRGTAIQLSTYSRILKAGDAWPKTAYYIVVTKDLLTVHGDIAPNLYRINGEYENDVWSRVETAINSTTERLAKGIVDVGLDDESPRALAESGRVTHAPCKYCDYRLFCRTDRRSA